MSNIEFTRDVAPHETEGITLLIIDGQRDFHENGTKANNEAGRGSLAVTGADEDAKKIAAMIMNNIGKITNIYVTMDSHHKKHIAHQAFWVPKNPAAKAANSKLTPFTVLRHKEDDVTKKLIKGCLFEYEPGKPEKLATSDSPGEPEIKAHYREGSDHKPIGWQPKDVSLKTWVTEYSKKLHEAKNQFNLVIWPDHCLIGTIGHSMQPTIQEALMAWNRDRKHCNKTIKYITKGMNCLTEMYSAIEAEVPIESDPATTVNEELLHALCEAQRLIVCGQAKSHCCNYTVRDIVKYSFGQEFKNKLDKLDKTRHQADFDALFKPLNLAIGQIYLLQDCMSNVDTFEADGDAFFDEMAQLGLVLINSDHPDLFILSEPKPPDGFSAD